MWKKEADWRQIIERAMLLVTLVLSIIVAALSAFDILPVNIVMAAVLTALALVTAGLELNRHANSKTREQLDRLISRVRLNANSRENHTDCQEDMAVAIKESIASGKRTRVRVIGVALKFSWTFLDSLISELVADDGLGAGIDLELALLNDDWEPLDEFREWKIRTKGTDKLIEEFRERRASLFREGMISLSAYHYSHFPIQHGLVVNEDALFRSHCEWTRAEPAGPFRLTVGENRYEIYRGHDPEEITVIRRFIELFEYYKSDCRENRKTPFRSV